MSVTLHSFNCYISKCFNLFQKVSANRVCIVPSVVSNRAKAVRGDENDLAFGSPNHGQRCHGLANETLVTNKRWVKVIELKWVLHVGHLHKKRILLRRKFAPQATLHQLDAFSLHFTGVH